MMRNTHLLWLLVAALPLAGSSPCHFDESSEDSANAPTVSDDTTEDGATDTATDTASDDDRDDDDDAPSTATNAANDDDADDNVADDDATDDDVEDSEQTDPDDTATSGENTSEDCTRDRTGTCCENSDVCFPECGCDPCDDVECSDDLTCLDGFCVTPATVECVDDGGCVTNNQCTTEGHACRPQGPDAPCGACEPSCIVDADCPEGTVCNPFDIYGVRFCDAPDAFCTRDDQCDTATQMCHEGQCIGLPPCWNGYLCPLFAPGEYGNCDDMRPWPDGPDIYDTYASPAGQFLCFVPPCGPFDYAIEFLFNCGLGQENLVPNPAFRCDARDQLCHPLVPMNIESLSTGCGDYGAGYEVYRGRCVTACEQLAIPDNAECSEELVSTCRFVAPDGYEYSGDLTASACRLPNP